MKQITDAIRAKIVTNFTVQPDVAASALAKKFKVEEADVQAILDELKADAAKEEAAAPEVTTDETVAGGNEPESTPDADPAGTSAEKQIPDVSAEEQEQNAEATPGSSLEVMLKDIQDPEANSAPVQEEPQVDLPIASANPTPDEIANKLKEMLAQTQAQQAKAPAARAPRAPSAANPNATPRARVTTHTIASCPSVVDGVRVQRRNTSIPDRAIIILTSAKARIAWLTTDVHFTNRTNEAAIKKALEELNRQKTSRDLIRGVDDWVLVVTDQKWAVGDEVQLAKANYYDYYRGMGYTVLGKRPNTTVVNNVVASEPYNSTPADAPVADAPVVSTPANEIPVETASPEAQQETVPADQGTAQEA